jgi:uncharacterized protein (TIGR02145 family)
MKAGQNKQPAWCYYDNNKLKGKKYEKLYNVYVILDTRGLAPARWQISILEEWNQLIDNLGGDTSQLSKFI